jgi:phosphohistidine swiveling domain-containing protein/ketosteroid isomerase-like protein
VRECVGALVSGDVKAALALCSPDVEVEESPRWPDRKTYRGREGAMRAYETMLDAFEDVRFEAEDFIEIGDQVVAFINVHGRGRESGVETEARIAYLYSVHAGRITRIRVFDDRSEAEETAESEMREATRREYMTETGKGSEIPIEDLEFEPPSPGAWELDPVHFPRPACRFTMAFFEPPFHRGFEETLKRYGAMIRYPEYRFVNGFFYRCTRPAPEEEIPERFENAARALEQKLWREDMRRWEEQVKPAAIERHLELQSVDPTGLDGEDLIDHLAACLANIERGLENHHRFNSASLFPTGDFLVQGSELAGVSPAELLVLLSGSAPVSGAAADGLDRLADAIRKDDKARSVLGSDDDPAGVLDTLTEADNEVGVATRQYLDRVYWRLLDGFEVCDPCACEKPEVLVKTIRRAVDGSGETLDTQQAGEQIRDAVPDAQRERFDELLAEARHTYRLRDERGIYNDGWATGLTRRAILAAGERLAAEGRVAQAADLADAEFEEIVSLLRGGSEPTGEELAARASFRSRYTAADAPPLLGDEPQPPPPLDGLPEPAARVMQAIGTAIGLIFEGSEAEHEEKLVRGLPASPGTYEGTARVLTGPDELERLQEGDVLVTGSTSESFNIALPLLGAIVTDSGGLLSHPAIVAREFGIPGVVGTREATRLIADGARVRVDGGAGEVRVIS